MLGGVVVLTAWGIISFRALPVEAYPDVANNYVQIITQWPGRSAEEIERQVTVPVEIQMAGIPHLDASALDHAGRPLQPDADLRRRHHQRRESRARAGAAEPGEPARQPGSADGHGLEPGGPDLLVHAGEHQPRLRRDGEEVARRLVAGKVVQERARAWWMFRASAGRPRSTRSSSIRRSWSPTG